MASGSRINVVFTHNNIRQGDKNVHIGYLHQSCGKNILVCEKRKMVMDYFPLLAIRVKGKMYPAIV
jgi:hypothetical protein